jgi:hypothetical protein
MTLFSMARPVAFKVPRAQALPTPFRPNCCNRVITHEREWLLSENLAAIARRRLLRSPSGSRDVLGALRKHGFAQ